MKILHISSDEKFIDMGLRVFESVAPNRNELLVLSNNEKCKFVKFENKKILTKKKLNDLSKNDDFWKGIDVVILHSLCIYKIHIPNRIKVVWIGFGFDYYDLIVSNYSDLLGEKTKLYAKKLGIKTKIKKVIKKIIFWDYIRRYRRDKIIQRIDYFCPVLTSEYELIKWTSKRQPKLLDWNYGTMEDDWAKDLNINASGNDVLLGNSANFSCNHMEGIDFLNSINGNKPKLIIPLSYGNKEYAKVIKSYTDNNYLGEAEFLDDFMSFDDYINIISSCGFAVMPHKRQQGLGNIILMINLGAKIFLDIENPIYTFLKEKGMIIFSLQDINENDFIHELTKEQKQQNRCLLYNIWGRDVIYKKTKLLIN